MFNPFLFFHTSPLGNNCLLRGIRWEDGCQHAHPRQGGGEGRAHLIRVPWVRPPLQQG